jgi:hypothetical protein
MPTSIKLTQNTKSKGKENHQWELLVDLFFLNREDYIN